MFQNGSTVCLFVCSIVFVQALYYIIKLEIKKPSLILESASLASSSYRHPSDRYKTAVQQSHSDSVITLTQNSSKFESVSINVSVNLTLLSSTPNITTSTLNSSFTNITVNITTTSTTAIKPTTTPIALGEPFANASFSSNFTVPNPILYNSLPNCSTTISSNDSSAYKVIVNQTIYSHDVIEQRHGTDVHPGGHWFPSKCQADQRVAIIVCYRQREQHLKMFLNNIHPFLKRQQLDYTIFIVNQHGTENFNRAQLFNVGYLEAIKLYPYTCFIFHDVDLLPEDERNIYRCGDQPRHMSVGVDIFNYKLLYSTLFGGVTAFQISDFLGTNGYPTVFWGWGGEDDDMSKRVVKKLKKSITRYPIEIARYKMIRTHNHKSAQDNPHRYTILDSKYDYNLDGISTTRYQLNQVIFFKLFTLINVTLTEETFEQIRTRLHIKKEEKKMTMRSSR